jgi:hypothetical protein
LESARVRVGGSMGFQAKSVFPVLGEIEGRVFELKDRLAWLAYRSRDVRVVRAASRLLIRLTELLEDLEEYAGDPSELALLLGRLSVLEAEAEGLLRRPELAQSSS